MLRCPLLGAAVLGLALMLPLRAAEPTGEQIFIERCSICHQANGQGAPPVYPPLASSDWLWENRYAAIKAVCEGLSGEITVKDQKYNNAMPAQMLDDAQVASVLSFVMNSWGNKQPRVTEKEVAAVRASSRFPTFEALQKASAYAPLPTAPEGWTIREVVQLPEFCTRMAGFKDKRYLLGSKGNVYLLDTAAGAAVPIIKNSDYLDLSRGDLSVTGMTEAADGHLWIVTNQRLVEERPIRNEIMIYRTSNPVDGIPGKPKPYLRTAYPYGIGSFNHGVGNLAFGPDGLLYVASGSRTDGGESGTDDKYFKGGEVDLTACLWRIDTESKTPKIDVIARGLRNAYGFAWDDQQRLFTVSNGPDANAPEEMDYIQAGRHYGFPYQFSNWPLEPKPYAYTPEPPKGVKFTPPVVNLGPDGGGTSKGLSTFDPHSSPCGVMWCGGDYAEPLRNTFLMTRFGNLLGAPAAPEDVGFDVLALKMEPRAEDAWALHAKKVLGPLGRPIDVIASTTPGSVLVLEYTRPLNFKDKLGWLPGRVLELSPKK